MPAAAKSLRRVWLDVDGTCELGCPTDWAALQENREKYPPLGRDYNYNLALFDALEKEQLRSVLLFTAYRAAAGASTTSGVLRCELIDWLQQRNVTVLAVATLLDPVYERGVGAYYAEVIGPVERAALACGRPALKPQDEVPLPGGEVLTFGEIVGREERLLLSYYQRFKHTPDKTEMARYVLRSDPSTRRVLFFDDMPHFLGQVSSACEEAGVDLTPVRVRPDMLDAEDYLAVMAPGRRSKSGGCSPS